jgi:AraC-like DNA-binding protein
MIDHPLRDPLHRFQLFSTTVPEEMGDALINVLGAREFVPVGDLNDFQARGSYLQMKNVSLMFGECNAPVRLKFPEGNLIRQQLAIRGRGRTSFGGAKFDVTPDETVVIPAGVEMKQCDGAGLAQFILRIDPAALKSKLGALLGTTVAKNIEFATPSSFANPELQRLRRLIEFIVSELDREDGGVPAHALAEFEQMLLVGFLTANHNNFSHLMERDHARPAPWQVRLIEDYIDANWKKPITIEMLADVTGGSARSIFKTFKETRGCTPMAFVKQVRLNNARRLLQSPEETTSVIGVALACGFLNSGHFARDYRLAFGELPSVTLNNSRRSRV